MNQTGTWGTGSPRAALRNAEEATSGAGETVVDTLAIVAGQAARRDIGTTNRA
jgi:hypothetical protein